MRYIAAMALAGLTLTACEMTDGGSTVSQSTVRSAESVTQIVALGGRKLAASDIRSELLDRKLDEGSWTWTIASDGTASSAADDGSWTSTSIWELEGSKYCRENDTVEYKCSHIYEVGGIYRFSKEDGSLESWSVTAG